jgi:hypothetical protein
MSEGFLKTQQRALEEVFFAQQEEILLKRLREEDQRGRRREGIAASTGITDPEVLERLLALDLGPQTITALGLVPLLLVAWADGALDRAEADAVHRAAAETGLAGQAEALALLEHWLKAPPSAKLADAWRGYARAVLAALPAETRAAVARDLLASARMVAEAAGGFLGLGRRVSDAEAKALAELERLLLA